ncbi:MAG: ATP-grasp domain-containing protein [Deltaproteobacteria bacterium]|nr:ATP-grasp domain-containing protein [Deltaproteobacteria bacterium]
MSRLLATLHDPWMALCLAHALSEELSAVITYGDAAWAARFEALGVPFLLVPFPDEATTLRLLADDRVAAFIAEEPSRLLSFKPSRRLEQRAAELGATLALPPASIAQRLENKLTLRQLAAEAGIVPAPGPSDPVGLPPQAKVTVGPQITLEGLRELVGAPEDESVVVQSPRGFMGRKTWSVGDETEWDSLVQELNRRPVKVSRFISGRPGTINAVVDSAGTVLCTAPIVQVTGDPRLTPYRLGSCGNDFTWRPSPSPEDGPYELARRLGPVLAMHGYRGHFGLDFVVQDLGEQKARTWLIEINPRLTASMALYSAWRPVLARAHVAVLDGSELRSTGELPPLGGGQLILHNLGDQPSSPLTASETGLPVGGHTLPATACVWPQATTEVAPGGTRGRLVRKGAVVNHDGALLMSLRN